MFSFDLRGFAGRVGEAVNILAQFGEIIEHVRRPRFYRVARRTVAPFCMLNLSHALSPSLLRATNAA
jgi:hypothetical protein